jgi:hypothetical protein
VVDVAQILKVFDGPVVPAAVRLGLLHAVRGAWHSPLHEEDSRHQAVGDQHAHAREVGLAKLPPHALVEAAHAVIGVGGAFSIGNAVEEVAIVGALLPHALHLGRTWLEVAKVLLAEARLFEDGDLVARKGRRRRLVRGERAQDTLGRLPGASIG